MLSFCIEGKLSLNHGLLSIYVIIQVTSEGVFEEVWYTRRPQQKKLWRTCQTFQYDNRMETTTSDLFSILLWPWRFEITKRVISFLVCNILMLSLLFTFVEKPSSCSYQDTGSCRGITSMPPFFSVNGHLVRKWFFFSFLKGEMENKSGRESKHKVPLY